MNDLLLITGANSLLARHTIEALRGARHIRAVDVQISSVLPENVEARTGDLRDLNFVRAICEGVADVIHLAPLYTRLASDEATLDHATRGTFQLMDAAAKAGARRVVLGSTLALFADTPAEFRVDEGWRPRPTPHLDDLCAWLAELGVREMARSTQVSGVCLRLGQVVDDAVAHNRPFDPLWVHVDDAVAAIRAALQHATNGWFIVHVPSADSRARFEFTRTPEEFAFAPQRDFAGHTEVRSTPTIARPSPIPRRPSIHKVALLGAGGPLAAATTRELAPHYTLRLADIKPVEEILATGKPQSPGAPMPEIPHPPHEWRVMDVRDPAQVMSACEGVDAIINCTVLRSDPADAFLVNTLGAYNVMRAAVAHGIQRVVHTGPFMLGAHDRTGYDWDHDIVDDVPPRPGKEWVYMMSKYFGQEICRIFAEHYGMVVPALTFCQFVEPTTLYGPRIHPLTISWSDAARAIRCALEVAELPAPFEYFHIGADLPHGVFRNDKAKRLLGWQPRDRLEAHYRARRQSA
ncbi:MAG: NAD-dependent epimerase/dehydratase family protein [Thermoflexales bacterium]|nr:NAD-dependent epimerase/dehydratase family protein [Thermoflexales bacterium]